MPAQTRGQRAPSPSACLCVVAAVLALVVILVLVAPSVLDSESDDGDMPPMPPMPGQAGQAEECTGLLVLDCGSGVSTDDQSMCEAQLNADMCTMIGPLAGVAGSGIVLFFILLIACTCVPCITFAITWMTCVNNKQKLGQSPTGGAWSGCCGIFWLVVILGGMVFPPFLPFYFIGSVLMLFPFCMESCYSSACRLALLVSAGALCQASMRFADCSPLLSRAQTRSRWPCSPHPV